MKKYRSIITLFVITLVASCTKQEFSTNDKDVFIDVDNSFILFDAGTPTRGALVKENHIYDKFNVIGYQYPTSWGTENTTILPNVFENTPQEVTYENGIYTYNPPKRWTGNTYSFFAYYPIDNNVTLFDGGTSIKRGVPYITYTLPSSNDPRKLIDVLTASFIDTGVNYSTTNTVQFEMQHRLAAIDICARNNYKYDDDSNPNTAGVPVKLEITNLELQLTNIYTSAKFYLDNTKPEYTSDPTSNTRTYQIIGNEYWGAQTKVLVPNDIQNSNLQYITTEDVNKETTLLLIPQENLNCHINLTYQKRNKDNNEPIDTPITVEKDITFTRPIEEGYRYYIELVFTSDAVSIRVDALSNWEDLKNNVEHKFE